MAAAMAALVGNHAAVPGDDGNHSTAIAGVGNH